MNDASIRVSRNLRNVNRFATNFLLRPYNDAEHCFGVGIIGSAVIEELRHRDPQKWTPSRCYFTLSQCLLHDLHEGITGDVRYDVKRATAILNRELTEVERKVELNLGIDFSAPHFDLPVTMLCDMTELALHLTEELRTGNKDPELETLWYFGTVSSYLQALRLNCTVVTGLMQRCYEEVVGWKNADLPWMAFAWVSDLRERVNPIVCYAPRCGSEMYTGKKLLLESFDPRHQPAIDYIHSNASITWGAVCEFCDLKGQTLPVAICRALDRRRKIIFLDPECVNIFTPDQKEFLRSLGDIIEVGEKMAENRLPN
jgi:hypothetical protein